MKISKFLEVVVVLLGAAFVDCRRWSHNWNKREKPVFYAGLRVLSRVSFFDCFKNG